MLLAKPAQKWSHPPGNRQQPADIGSTTATADPPSPESLQRRSGHHRQDQIDADTKLDLFRAFGAIDQHALGLGGELINPTGAITPLNAAYTHGQYPAAAILSEFRNVVEQGGFALVLVDCGRGQELRTAPPCEIPGDPGDDLPARATVGHETSRRRRRAQQPGMGGRLAATMRLYAWQIVIGEEVFTPEEISQGNPQITHDIRDLDMPPSTP